MKFKIDSKEQLSKIQSEIMNLRTIHEREGMNRSDAHKLSADEVGLDMTPPIEGDELLSAIGYALHDLHEPIQPQRQINERGALGMYIEWCSNYHFVPSDVCLSHFTSFTAAAYQYARNKMVVDGWQFEKCENGWNIISAPESEKVYTEADLQRAIAEFVRGMKK